MTKEEKAVILQMLYGCITNPEIDEDDAALVDYRAAKTMILSLPEDNKREAERVQIEVSHRCYPEILQLLRDWYAEEIEEPEELAEYICQIIKGFTADEIESIVLTGEEEEEDETMLCFIKNKEKELSTKEKKELAIATLQAVKNGTKESEKLQTALDWAIDALKNIAEDE